ncbi:MAG TPA: hypothetical protein VF454_00335 [Gemmatimonadales bacterium]
MTDKEKEATQVPAAPLDYFVVTTRSCAWWPVSTVMARHIERQLDRLIPTRWIRFVELSGATILVRADEIIDIAQCSADQRAERRAFGALMQQEREGERW